MSESYTQASQTETSILAEFTKLRDEIGIWAGYNFDVHLPELGIAEEIGELTHAILKREQKIRGEHTNQTTDLMRDALADATIYMLHLAHNHNLRLSFAKELSPLEDEMAILGAMHHAAGSLILNIHHFHSPSVIEVEHAYLMTLLWTFSGLHGFNLLEITSKTWSEVCLRDWRKFPQNGLTA